MASVQNEICMGFNLAKTESASILKIIFKQFSILFISNNDNGTFTLSQSV